MDTIRIARPSRDLAAAERFWVEGFGLEVLHRADDTAQGGHALLMLGGLGQTWHLELVATHGDPAPAPTDEDLLVVYRGATVDDDVERLVAAGGVRVRSRNPYWDEWGATVVDPDGYRLVLSTRTWP